PAPVEKAKATLFFQYRSAKRDAGEVRSECVQAASVREVLAHAGAALKREALRAPIKLDLVERRAALSATDPLLDGFKLRPGLDGVCAAERCLLGWQLAAREMVNENTPISAIPELRMGFSPARVRRALGQAPEHGLDGLTRIETRSFIYDGQLTELLRMHRAAQELSRASVKRAGKLAERHIVRALGDDGRYRYQHHPFRGHSDTAGYNLPRQAGTTLVLCELGAGTETAPAI